MKIRLLFIINPVSGGKSKGDFKEFFEPLIPSAFSASFTYTNQKDHARQLVKDNFNNYDVFVAVGGDGTINEIASAITNTDKILGIIPYGSGNGLARSLKIPINVKKAFAQLISGKERKIDAGEINGNRFFNMAGIGFDAHISAKFVTDKTRGLKGYIRTTIKEIANYKSQQYVLTIDGKEYERKAFMISIANSSQYGNNAHVSPYASLQDGLLDVCIIKPFPLYHFPMMVYHMFSKTADQSKYVEIIKGKDILIKREFEDAVHKDGEAFLGEKDIKITVEPLSLKVIA